MKKKENILNKYWIVCILFIIITFFIGDNSIFKQISYNREIKNLKSKIKFYTKKNEENLKKLSFFYGDNKNLEKIIREEYFMAKSDEDFFFIKNNW
jgi:cell division protein FtsB